MSVDYRYIKDRLKSDGISLKTVANRLGMADTSLCNKLNRARYYGCQGHYTLSVDDLVAIRDEFMPDVSLERMCMSGAPIDTDDLVQRVQGGFVGHIEGRKVRFSGDESR